MRSSRTIALPFYVTALVIASFPFVEFVLTIAPWSPGVLSWRFGAVGLLVRAIMTPLVALALIYGTALHLGHRRVLRAVAAGSLVGAVVLIALMGIFALDLIDMRGLVLPESSLAFDTSSAMVLSKLLAVSAVLLAFAFAAVGASRSTGKTPRDPMKALWSRSGREST